MISGSLDVSAAYLDQVLNPQFKSGVFSSFEEVYTVVPMYYTVVVYVQ